MKTSANILQKSLLVLGVFCVTTFVSYGATSVWGGLFKSTPYTTINAVSDAQLSQLTNGTGPFILDGIIDKVRTNAETAGGNPINSTLFNAYIDNYLDRVDQLDDAVRAMYGLDYTIIFQYIYPRVLALRMGGSGFDTIFDSLSTEADVTNDSNNGDAVIWSWGTTNTATTSTWGWDTATATNTLPTITVNKATAKVGDSITFTYNKNGGTNCYSSDQILKNEELYGSNWDVNRTAGTGDIGTHSITITCTFNGVARTSTPANLTVSAATTATQRTALDIAANPAIDDISITVNKTTVISWDTVEFSYNIWNIYTHCNTQTHSNYGWSPGNSGNVFLEWQDDRQGMYSMKIDNGITGVIIDCHWPGIDTRFDGGGPDKEILFTTVSTTSTSTIPTGGTLSTGKNTQTYRIAVTKENCPAILKAKGLPKTIYTSDGVKFWSFSIVQCDFSDNNTWNKTNYFGGYKYSGSNSMAGWVLAGAEFAYDDNSYTPAPAYSENKIISIYPAPTVSANDVTNTVTGFDQGTMEYTNANWIWALVNAPDLTGTTTVYVRHKKWIYDTAEIKALNFTAAIPATNTLPTMTVNKTTAKVGETVTFTWSANGGTNCYWSDKGVKGEDLSGTSWSIPVVLAPESVGSFSVTATCTFNGVAKTSTPANFTVSAATTNTTATASPATTNICPAGKTCSFTATCDRTKVSGSSADICSADDATVAAWATRTTNGMIWKLTGQTTCDKTQFGLSSGDLVYWTITNCTVE